MNSQNTYNLSETTYGFYINGTFHCDKPLESKVLTDKLLKELKIQIREKKEKPE